MKYELPELEYGYKDLEPYISEKQLEIHHSIHHLGYVNGANALTDKMKETRKNKEDIDMKAALKELSFHVGGHILHSIFWESMAPEGKGGGEPDGKIKEMINKEYGDNNTFKNEFTQAAASVEGSGWATLVYCKHYDEIKIMQIEKHNANIFPQFKILLCIDVWEHAYYLDYQNKRPEFINNFWKIINWDGVNKRLAEIAN